MKIPHSVERLMSKIPHSVERLMSKIPHSVETDVDSLFVHCLSNTIHIVDIIYFIKIEEQLF